MTTEKRLMKGAELMNHALSMSTGLRERDRKLVSYWTLATHMLSHLDVFPLLVLRGKMGTGKSETLKVIAKFAHQPHSFNLRGKTLPVVRDELETSYQGTAIMEEADQGWKDDSTVERLLSDRYHRQAAEAGLKQKAGDQWVSITKRTFGATVLHRRMMFNDAALNGRSITIRFRFDATRQYMEVSDERQPWIVEGSELMKGLVFAPIAIDQPQGVAPRIFNTYRPLFVIAKLCGDEGFAQLILESLLLDTAQLKEAQSVEPDGLVLRAITSLVCGDEDLVSPPRFANIKFSDIGKWIWVNHRETLQPKQIGGLAREELGLATAESHGVTVVVPSPASLLKACQECGYEDSETIAELKRHVMGNGGQVDEVE